MIIKKKVLRGIVWNTGCWYTEC